jgi:hypothetical protein
MQAANVQFYEGVVAERAAAPTAFARAHSLWNEVLTNPIAMYDYVKRWQEHPVRFENRHPVLWKILDGYVHQPTADPAVLSGNEKGTVNLTVDSNGGFSGTNGAGGGNGNDPGNSAGGGGVTNGFGDPGPLGSAIPEPSAFVLLCPGIVCAMLAARRRVKSAQRTR